jgi:hypothetical protein
LYSETGAASLMLSASAQILADKQGFTYGRLFADFIQESGDLSDATIEEALDTGLTEREIWARRRLEPPVIEAARIIGTTVIEALDQNNLPLARDLVLVGLILFARWPGYVERVERFAKEGDDPPPST